MADRGKTAIIAELMLHYGGLEQQLEEAQGQRRQIGKQTAQTA